MSSLVCPKMKIMKSSIKEATFFDLPYPIMSYILSCLPTKTILSCKLVCKHWRSVINDPQFSKSSNSVTVLIRRVLENNANKSLHFVEPEVDCTKRVRNGLPCLMLGNEALIKFKDDDFNKFRVEMLSIVNCCKGLVCLELKKGVGCDRKRYKMLEDLGYEPYFICNPLTSDYEIVKYPRPTESSSGYEDVGFGFCSQSGRYKVIRLFNNWINDGLGESVEADVCAVGGDDEWRRLENWSLDNNPRQGRWGLQNAMFFEGRLHWIVRQPNKGKSNIAVVFNCQEETLNQMDLPPDDATLGPRTLELATLHSRLCFCVRVKDQATVIWVMNEYGVNESWSKLFVVSAGKSDSINRNMPLKPLAYLNNGEILMLSFNGELVAYNVTLNTWRAIKIPGIAAKIEAMLFDPVFIPTKNVLGIE